MIDNLIHEMKDSEESHNETIENKSYIVRYN